jgi:hypothetical protein
MLLPDIASREENGHGFWFSFSRSGYASVGRRRRKRRPPKGQLLKQRLFRGLKVLRSNPLSKVCLYSGGVSYSPLKWTNAPYVYTDLLLFALFTSSTVGR